MFLNNKITFQLVTYTVKRWIKYSYIVSISLVFVLCLHLLYVSDFNVFKIIDLENFIMYILLLFSLITFIYILHTLDLKLLNEVGTISIEKNNLIIKVNEKTEEYFFQNFKQIIIIITGYNGQQLTGGIPPKSGIGGLITSDGYNQLQGYENKIKFIPNEGKSYGYNFYIKNEEHSLRVKDFLKNISGINKNLKLKIIR